MDLAQLMSAGTVCESALHTLGEARTVTRERVGWLEHTVRKVRWEDAGVCYQYCLHRLWDLHPTVYRWEGMQMHVLRDGWPCS